jgi:hypothetical protein
MRRSLSAAIPVAALALAVPAGALALDVQIANTGTIAAPSCPANPCAVVSRTTAIQVKDGSDSGPFVVKRTGRIVSWSVTLADPSSGQIHFFDKHEGGTARAAIAILRNTGDLDDELIATGPVTHLQPDFGKTAQLTLSRPIPVVKGDIVALSVPTWLPALGLAYPTTTSWRASRSVAECSDVTRQTVQRTVGSVRRYDCLYQTALVTYSATETTTG